MRVFDSGLRKTVFVDRGNGNFEARRVETGWRLGDRVEIVKGLMEGERVVVAANFLLDSESRMRAASAGIFNPETDPVCGMEVDQTTAAGEREADRDARRPRVLSSAPTTARRSSRPTRRSTLGPHDHAPAKAPAAAKAPMAGMPAPKSGSRVGGHGW